MPTAVGYKPDPDFEEPGYGTFSYDDGSSMYGYDPELASEVSAYRPSEALEIERDLSTMPDARVASNETRPPIDEQRRALDEYFSGGDLSSLPDFTPTAAPKAEPPPATPAARTPDKSTTPEATATPPDPIKQARSAIEEHADGLDPEKLQRIIGFETAGSFSPAAVNPNGVHAGLIQFNKDNWPGVAKAAGKPDVTWDEMRQMSVAEQMPFVASYFKERGITKDSSLGDYYMAVAAPGLMGKSDDTVAYKKGSKAAEQNPLWDLDKDGQVTVGELKNVIPDGGAQGQFNMEADAARNGAPGSTPVASRGQPAGMQVPSINGMTPSQIQMDGTPLSPDQIAARQRDIYDRTMQQVGSLQQAGQGRVDALALKRQELDRQEAERRLAGERERVRNAKIVEDAQKKIDAEVTKPIQKVDPRRVIKNMSTGDKVLGAIALLLSGFGQALQESVGFKAQKELGAYRALMRGIDEDIESQKEEIRSGEVSKNNRIAAWTRQLGNAEMGVKAAELELREAARMRLDSHDVSQEEARIQGEVATASQNLMAQSQALSQQLADMEANRMRLTYARPTVPSYKDQLEEERAKRALGGATGGKAPEIAKVGTEDESEEARATLADEYDPEKTTHKGQMTALGKEMGQVTKLEENLATLEQAYGVTADENGNYPKYKGNEDKYSTTATGPWYNIADALDPDDPVDRTLKDAWSQVETGTREGWKTEPNGDVKQDQLGGIDKAKRDEDVPEKLKALRLEIERRKTTIMSSTDAPVRAAYKIQNDYPLAGQDRGAQVTGKIPTEEDEDGLTESQRTAPFRRPAGGY